MKIDIQDIEKLREVLFSLPPDGPEGEDCPDPETLWKAVGLELPPQQRRQIVDHVASCPACAEEWRLAVGFSREAGRLDPVPGDVQPEPIALAEPAARPRGMVVVGPWWKSRHFTQIAAAASLVIAALGVGWVMQPGEMHLQGAIGGVVERGIGEVRPVSALDEDRPLSRSSFLLRWTPGPVGARYDLRVLSENPLSDPLIQVEDLASTEYEVPEAALRDLAPRSKVLWQVEAVLPDGDRLPSDTFIAVVE